jgi:hypothetical protein
MMRAANTPLGVLPKRTAPANASKPHRNVLPVRGVPQSTYDIGATTSSGYDGHSCPAGWQRRGP